MFFRSSVRDPSDAWNNTVALENHYRTTQKDDDRAAKNRDLTDFTKQQQKLYNRSTEQSEILEAYNRIIQSDSSSSSTTTDELLPLVRRELVLIQGETGSGKTALAQSMKSKVVGDGGYYIGGKFDQMLRPEPYSVYINALTEFSTFVLANGDEEVSRIRMNVRRSIKTEQKVLLDMVPSLEKILGPIPVSIYRGEKQTHQHEHQSYLCADAVNRFKYVFRMFMQAISSNEHPVVLLLDDVHWADESSLDLLESLLQDTTTNDGIMYIFTFREEVVSDRLRQLLLNVTADDNSQICLTRLVLRNFDSIGVNSMISDLLSLDSDATIPLADIVFRNTNGNIFFILELLRWLYADRLIQFSTDSKKWSWDINKLSNATTTSLNEMITSTLQTLPPETLQFLQYASSLGTRLDENILKHLASNPMSYHIPILKSYGFVEYDPSWQGWMFSHDKIKEASYGLIPIDQRNTFHYGLGKELWRQLTVEEIDHYIFVIVGQLLLGSTLVTKPEEKTAVAKLCFLAGEKSVQISHFRSAFDYLSQAMSFISAMTWREEYDFCLSLYNAAAEVAYCNGDFGTVYKIFNDILYNVKAKEDTMQAYCIKLYSVGSQGRLNDAIESGLTVLKDLGEKFTADPSILRVVLEMRKVQKKLKGKSDHELLNLPLLSDQRKLDAMKIMSSIILYVYMDRGKLAVMMGLRMLNITLTYGKCAISSIAFSIYAALVSKSVKGIDDSLRYGNLGLQMYEMFQVQQWVGRIYSIFYGVIRPLKLSLTESIEPLNYAYLVSLEKGDVEFAFLNGYLSLWLQFQSVPLLILKERLLALMNHMLLFSQHHNVLTMTPSKRTIELLLEHDKTDINLDLDEPNMKSVDDENLRQGNKTLKSWWRFYAMVVCHCFGFQEKAYQLAKVCAVDLANLTFGDTGRAMYLFYIGLINVEQARRSRYTFPALTSKKCLKQLKLLAQIAPSNNLGKQYLLEAEILSLHRKNAQAFVNYTSAIALAKNSGFTAETALCNERAAKFLYSIGDIEHSKQFFREALQYYEQWGSTPKVKFLQNEIIYLFGSLDNIVQQEVYK